MQSRNEKKLLVVVPYFYPKIGGVEKHTYNLYKGLKKKFNYKIVIITSNHENKIYKEEFIEGMKVYRLPRQFKISNTPISFRWRKKISEIINKENPSIIMAHSPVPFISDITILSNKRIPSIIKYHSGSMKKEKAGFKNLIIFFYEKLFLPWILKRVSYIIFTSDFVKEHFLRGYESKSQTITPSVDLNLFKPENKRLKQITILYVGRIDKTSKWKGINFLIGAILFVRGKFPNVKLNLIGEGDAVEDYKDMVKKLKLSKNVVFSGALRGKDLVVEYNNSSLLALPSVSEAESFGMVLIEAMACKKPVVGSNIGGVPYVIDDKVNGFLVPPRNSRVLAEAIIKILNNPKEAKQMGEAGYKKVIHNFTLDHQIQETNKVILKVLKEHQEKQNEKKNQKTKSKKERAKKGK